MNGIIIFTAIIFFLWIARSVLIPILIAGFLWYLMNAISDYYRRAMPRSVGTFLSRIFDWTANLAALGTICLILYLFATQIRPMFSELLGALPSIQEKLISLGTYFSDSIRKDVTVVMFLKGDTTSEDEDKIKKELEAVENIENSTMLQS